MKIKIRGVYSTALTNFLKEKGFEIIKPSEVMAQRMDLDDNDESADVLIYDKEDLNGVTINGSGADAVVKELQNNFQDVVIKKMEIGAIYCGKIKKIESIDKTIIVDIGNEEGILSLQNYWGFLREGEKVLAQVKGIINGKKLLSTQLRLFGDSMVLIKDGFTKVSKHIRTQKEIQRLIDISNNASIKNWGVLWKSLAEGKDTIELVSELNALVEKEKNLKGDFEHRTESGLILPGFSNYFVDFGAVTKQKFDKIRGGIVETIVGHHFLKSGGYALLTDFAESLAGLDNNVVVSKLNNTLWNDGPKEGSYYEIIHKKPGGKDIIFKGTVEKSTKEEIHIKRRLISGGRFDGLGGRIEQGDYALTIIKPNSWTVTHKYFSKEGFPKGVYVNINTPTEVYPKFSRYIDLEVDVVEKDNKKEIVDVQKLDRIVSEGIIKKELADYAMEIANKIVTEELK
ncbi:MAG: DUF402 domain-containing protein [Candidatus Nanoarchaeia archaeon]|nr:DUF402 domain-containing protein [Candidatus Nanoarchaeia archaeon]MDD5239510.1 DUF402 domain-containing protein [Candidatus Nanoarchaeia archaeon]